MYSKIVAIVAIAASLGACATVTRGTNQDFTVNSDPAGALASTSNDFSCVTPCTMKMPRKESFEVTISKDGYAPQTVSVRSQGSGAGAAGLAGNVIAGGIIGIGIDASSGAMNDLVPAEVEVVLQPAQ